MLYGHGAGLDCLNNADKLFAKTFLGYGLLSLVDKKLNMTQTCICRPESQAYPGLHQKHCDQQAEGGDCAPLLRYGDTPPRMLHPALGSQNKHMDCWSKL